MKLLNRTLILIACFVLPLSVRIFGSEKEQIITGTFSNLRYHKEAGDLLGVELKIVPVDISHNDRYQGCLQIAQGTISELIIVNIMVKRNIIWFKIPHFYKVYGGQVFKGAIDSTGIKGGWLYHGKVKEEIKLPRGHSYWDKPIN